MSWPVQPVSHWKGPFAGNRGLGLLLLPVAAAFLLMAVPSAIADTLTLKGSDTMVILGQRWAERFMEQHPGDTIQVTGGGSGTGIAALINGTTDIAESSREVKAKELHLIEKEFDAAPTEVVVARDGLSVYLRESNPVSELTLAQLREIFTGRITNWKEVGGADAKIITYCRESNSGTYVYFKEHVLEGEDYAPACQNLAGTGGLVNAVAKDPNGIGYGGIAYAKGVKFASVKRDDNSPAVQPSIETVTSGEYPIARPLYFYYVGEATGLKKQFIDFALSDEGQQIVEKVGYFRIQ